MEHNKNNQRPKVVVTILILRDGKVLLGQRKGDVLTDGMFGLPGGHMESLESFAECAQREMFEETGMNIETVRFVGITNVRDFAPAHFVTVILQADWMSGEPVLCEPDRCDGWGWYPLDDLPDNLTPATRDGLIALRSGQTLFE